MFFSKFNGSFIREDDQVRPQIQIAMILFRMPRTKLITLVSVANVFASSCPTRGSENLSCFLGSI